MTPQKNDDARGVCKLTGALLPGFIVLLSQMALVATIYWPTLQLGFVSDSWVYLARLRTSTWATLTTPTGYHYQPVACAWIALIRACFGESAAAFQAVLMLQLAFFGYLTYQLGRRLLPDRGIAFLGSLLVVGSAAFYEASYWPLGGNMHLLSAQLYIVAVILAIDVVRGRFVKTGPWLLGLTTLAAIFTHPVMVTAIPVCALILLLAGGDPDRDTRQSGGRPRKGTALLVLAAVAIPFALSRLVFAEDFSGAPKPGLGRMQAYWLISRGLVAAFSLRGTDDVIQGLMTLDLNVRFLSSGYWYLVAGWLLVAILAAVLCLWRARPRGIRILVAVLTIHAGLAAVAGGMSSRQSTIPAACAGLLTAWALRILAERLSSIAPLAPVVSVYRYLPAIGVFLLIAAAWPDHRAAAAVHTRAADLSRDLVNEIRTLAPPDRGPVNLTLVNMPGYTVDRGIIAATFVNGLVELTRLTSPAVASLQLWQLPISGAPTNFANGTTPITSEALRSFLIEQSRIALFFQMPSDIRVLTPDVLDVLTLSHHESQRIDQIQVVSSFVP